MASGYAMLGVPLLPFMWCEGLWHGLIERSMQGVPAQAGVRAVVFFPKEGANSLVVNRHGVLKRLDKDG